ncbi:MAG: hypothetical protein ACFCUN_05010 [Hyphomicrobiaceae bacterium]
MIELVPFDYWSVILLACLNPVVAAVAVFMGRSADQWQKLPIAGFAAALAGAVVMWIAIRIGLVVAQGYGAATGVFMLSFVVGTAWAAIGYATRGVGRRMGLGRAKP